jgi:serine protease
LLLVVGLAMSVVAPVGAFRCDIDGSGRVDSLDLIQISLAFGTSPGHARWNAAADLDDSGTVDGEDLALLGSQFGRYMPDFSADHVPGELVVLFREEAQTAAIDRVIQSLGARMSYRSESAPMVVLEVPEGMTERELADRLFDEPLVRYVEPNYIYRISWIPNDPLYEYQWHFEMINMPAAWDIERGGKSSVVVAVLDTGVAFENYGAFCRPKDLEKTKFVNPRDFVNGGTHPNDDQGHGTHVAGTIAQSTDDGYGVAGIAFNCSIMPVKVCGDCNQGCPLSAIVDGIRWAADHGADVINMSLGGPQSNIEHDAVIYAYEKGVVIVAAAGNGGGKPVDYPAAYPEVIAVGAVRMDKTRSYYSNVGTNLDLVAPGGDTRVDQDGDSYDDGVYQTTFVSGYINQNGEFCPDDYCDFGIPTWYQGTSMATPHVAGVVALIISRGMRGPEKIRDLLTSTATDLGSPGFDTQYGHGLLNAAKALENVTSGSWGWNN